MEKLKKIIIGFVMLLLFISCIFFGWGWYSSTKKLNETGNILNGVREQLDSAEGTITELRGRIDRCRELCGTITDTTDRNIETIRDCIDIVEELRVEVYDLENELLSNTGN